MLNKSIFDCTFTIFDTETTGGDNFSELVEISAVKIKPNLKLDLEDSFSELIKPSRRINEYGFAYKINRISNKMVENAPRMQEVIPRFLDFSKNTVIVAHNAPFDMRYLRNAAEICGATCEYIHILDTVRLARKAMPHLPNHKLDTLINELALNIEIKESARHRAMYDCINTAYIFIECIKFYKSKGLTTLKELK